MQILKCNNCGAKLNRRTYYCDYCGTQYTKASDGTAAELTPAYGRGRTQSSFVIPKMSKEQLVVTMEHLKTGISALLLPLAFMILWCSIAAGTGIGLLFSQQPFAASVPLFMSAIGIFALVQLIRGYKKDNVNPIIKMFKDGQTQEAYDLAKKKGLKSQDSLLISLLLAYHVFNDYDYLENNAIRVTNNKIKSTTNYTNAYCVLVEKYTSAK